MPDYVLDLADAQIAAIFDRPFLRVRRPVALADHDVERVEIVTPGAAYAFHSRRGRRVFRCPFGAPGTTVRVRETYKFAPTCALDDPQMLFSRADPNDPAQSVVYKALAPYGIPAGHGQWCGACFMPPWASRLHGTIVQTRVGRMLDDPDVEPDREGGAAFCAKRHDVFSNRARRRGLAPTSNPLCWIVDFRFEHDGAMAVRHDGVRAGTELLDG